jgi:hypothetical protein
VTPLLKNLEKHGWTFILRVTDEFNSSVWFWTFHDCKEAESELDVAQRFSRTYFSLDVDVHADE